MGGLVKLVMLWTQLFSQQISQLLKWLAVMVYITNAHGPKVHKTQRSKRPPEREHQWALSNHRTAWSSVLTHFPFALSLSLSLEKKNSLVAMLILCHEHASAASWPCVCIVSDHVWNKKLMLTFQHSIEMHAAR